MWRWNGGVPRVIKGLVGCPRILRYQPQPFDATVCPSGRTVYHTARAQWLRPAVLAGFPIIEDGGKLRDGTCGSPYQTSVSAATPLHFIYGYIGGIGNA